MSSAAAMIQRKGIDVTVARAAFVVDSAGSSARLYVPINGPYRMFPQPKSGAEALAHGRVEGTGFATFYALPGADVQKEDIIVVNGETWDVRDVRAPGGFGAAEATGHVVIDADRARSTVEVASTATAFFVTYIGFGEPATVFVSRTGSSLALEVAPNDIGSLTPSVTLEVPLTGDVEDLRDAIDATAFSTHTFNAATAALPATNVAFGGMSGPAVVDEGAAVKVGMP